MRHAAFFPVIPNPLADKGIGVFAPDVTPGADLAPPRQQFFLVHLSPFLQRPAPVTKTVNILELGWAALYMQILLEVISKKFFPLLVCHFGVSVSLR